MMLIAAGLIASGALFSASGAQTRRLTVTPERPEPGSVVRLSVQAGSGTDSVLSVTGQMAGEQLHFISAGGGAWRAIGGVPVDAVDSVVARAVVQHTSGTSDTVRAILRVPPPPPRRASAPRLSVDDRFTRPHDAATLARIEREGNRARQIGRRAHDSPPLWRSAFLKPRTSVVTSRFGTGRVFNGTVTSRHLGVDFRGAVGSQILAANRGVVALVDDFFLAGNVVYIDHGAGIVTGYFHMSQALVATGDTVARGDVIGLVGATGRTTGPHLHWTARYGELTVNPLDLVARAGAWYTGAGAVVGAGKRNGN
ncbi:MAG TPA: M23 family metallopeptidase [Gemmatimonadaceae bacterium]|nr:M23 family metallopeptidase [Gemmatimonadaceae bacterium]